MIHLQCIDEDELERLFVLATTDASPDEVMPPVEGPPGWISSRHDAFRAFYRSHQGELDTDNREVMFAIVHEGETVGSARLKIVDTDTFEMGLWLGRSWRRKGIGANVLRALMAKAAAEGATRLIAETTTSNAGALSILKQCGAQLMLSDSLGKVQAELRVA